jgi:DNA processing protein
MLEAHHSLDDIAFALRLLHLRGRRAPLREAILAAGGWTQWLDARGQLLGASTLTRELETALATPAPPALVDAVMAWLTRGPHRCVLPFAAAHYPAALRDAPSPPMLLFAEGDAALLQSPSIAVVGSRTPSPMGIDVASEYARGFSAAGICVISGLAAGIDAAAHTAALVLPGKTIAVLGCGPDIVFPTGNARLMREIAETGLLLTEYPPGVHPQRTHFPERNRIVAGLSLATVVIEARLRSGALISARLAAEAGRDVFAVPGSLRNLAAEGCHRLIREGAGLTTSPMDVIESLAPQLRDRISGHVSGVAIASTTAQAATATPDNWPADHKRLWSALGDDPTPMDELIERSGLTYPNIGPILLGMELDGRVEQHFGRYRRKLPARV